MPENQEDSLDPRFVSLLITTFVARRLADVTNGEAWSEETREWANACCWPWPPKRPIPSYVLNDLQANLENPERPDLNK